MLLQPNRSRLVVKVLLVASPNSTVTESPGPTVPLAHAACLHWAEDDCAGVHQ